MFLCKPCHKKVAPRCTWCEEIARVSGYGQSDGPCEKCGKTRVCFDCHSYGT